MSKPSAGIHVTSGSVSGSSGPYELSSSSFTVSQTGAVDGTNYQKKVAFAKTSLLNSVYTNFESRVRIYHSAEQQAADVNRSVDTTPTGDHGVILDYVSTGDETYQLSPGIVCNSDYSDMHVTITNLSGSTHNLTVTIYGSVVYTGVAKTISDITGLTAWFDPSNASTITESGGYVTGLSDLSGNSNDLMQTGTYGPITGTRTQNGLNVLDFFATTRAALYSGEFVQTQPCTIFMVTQTDTLTVDSFGRSCIIGWSGVSGYNGCGITQAGASGQIQLYAGGAFYTYHYLPVNSATQLTTVFGDGSSDVYRNGIIGTTLPPGTEGWGNGSRLMLGNAVDENADGKFSIDAAWNGWIGELLIYDGVLSTSDRELVENYLAVKWATGEAP